MRTLKPESKAKSIRSIASIASIASKTSTSTSTSTLNVKVGLILPIVLLIGCDRHEYNLDNNRAIAMGVDAFNSIERECDNRNPLNNAYFGDLHVHTTNSSDAYNFDVNVTPEEAYQYAFGEQIFLAPNDSDGKGTRPVQIDRPLDFAAVTDHAEFLGENRVCKDPASPAYSSEFCVETKSVFGRDYRLAARIFSPVPWRSDPPCLNLDAEDDSENLCRQAASTVWQETVRAADDWNDQSSACQRTTFVAYEYSSFRNGSNLHRNVVFRNNIVPPLPISYVEAPRAWDLWQALDRDCNHSDSGCEAIAIPHNSNISNGRMFAVDYPGASSVEEQRQRAELRVRLEPIIEMMQHKGDSECRRGLANVLGDVDELCDFEKFETLAFQRYEESGEPGACYNGPFADALPHPGPNCLSKLSYVRYALAEGLNEQQRIGANPFKFGLSAATDTHNGMPGGVQERDFAGHLGMGDDIAQKRTAWDDAIAGNTSNGPGGVIGVWAPQNTRDDIFTAMQRKEVFGTSGPRILPRFFAAADFPDDLCQQTDMLEAAYRDGTPMGGDVTSLLNGNAPAFLAVASADPGTDAFPGTDLQRLQIIKVWNDSEGNTHQRIFDVAGDGDNGASVNPATCQQSGTGFAQLCKVWRDPEFEASTPAVYYMRAVENPSCRYNAWQCMALPEDQRPEACNPGHTHVKLTQQERAWTSPIWYSPES